jgi:SAM-dependent methyltransferase
MNGGLDNVTDSPEGRRFPSDPDELRASDLCRRWWYYSVELLPGVFAKGQYPPDLPMLPRLMLRKIDLAGTSCLDMGTMEGLIPALMRRGGAAAVTAIDRVDHCVEKMEAVKHYYGVDFEYKSVGLMYELSRKLGGQSFDLINCSGLLYHVFSPLLVLCGVRPLLKRNGLMIVSTNVVLGDGYSMEFNDRGRMQFEFNTFWYLSVPLLDYLLRYLRLAPLDFLFFPHEAVKSDLTGYVFDKPSGYLSVLCRGGDEPLHEGGDEWMNGSARGAWEYLGMADWPTAEAQPISGIGLRQQPDESLFRPDAACLDLPRAVALGPQPPVAASSSDTHTLSLSDRS